jgi:phosphoribosylglycinamide formyltransferase-1
MSERPRIGILASGSGTTAEAFILGTQNGTVDADVRLVVTNNSDAGILDKVARFNKLGLGIDTKVINGTTHPGEAERGTQTRQESLAISQAFTEADITLVLLLGYMKKVINPLLRDFPILNTHPGRLPETRGLYGNQVQKFALSEGHRFSGQTLHAVKAEYDTGPTIAEHLVPIMPDDTAETLSAAVQAAEKANIARDVNAFIRERGIELSRTSVGKSWSGSGDWAGK